MLKPYICYNGHLGGIYHVSAVELAAHADLEHYDMAHLLGEILHCRSGGKFEFSRVVVHAVS